MLVTEKRAKSLPRLSSTTSKTQCYYVHPHITPDNDPSKGRLLRAAETVPAGTVVLIDSAYAIVPTVNLEDDNGWSICSNLSCSRRIAQNEDVVSCSRNCIRDVVWCNASCRAADSARHEYECLWLKRNGQRIREEEREYDFATLWHVVRLLAGWNLEIQSRSKPRSSSTYGFKEGWDAVDSCCDYLSSWPESQLKHWATLISSYLGAASGLPYQPTAEKLLSLICKEETNTFGLYPRMTGPLDAVDRSTSRGDCYGFGLYPRAAMFNHSCLPNVTHQPDHSNRMVYKAARDITKGEECTITYFDLTQHENVESRQNMVQDLFRFRCTCERCLTEEEEENIRSMESLPFSSDLF